jgi:tetratricopeptide (TPR) repeat protein
VKLEFRARRRDHHGAIAVPGPICHRVVGAIGPRLEQAEIERAKRKPTESLDAYDYYLRGMASFYQWTRESNQEALSLAYRAIELDPDFASAYAAAAICYLQRKNENCRSCE